MKEAVGVGGSVSGGAQQAGSILENYGTNLQNKLLKEA